MLISFVKIVKMKDEKVVVDESFTLRFEDQPPQLYPYFWDLEKAPQSPKSIKKQEPFEAKKVLLDESTQTEVFGNDLKTENENLKQRLAALEKRMEIIEEKLAFEKRINIIQEKLDKNQEPISTVKNTDVTEILKGKTLKVQLQRLEDMKNVTYHHNPDGSPTSTEDITTPVSIPRMGPVMNVRCMSTTALMYTAKYKSGSKGKCILLGDEWLTPNEFEDCAGSKAKKYLSSIKCQGRPLRVFVNSGELKGSGPPQAPKVHKKVKPSPIQPIAPAPPPGQAQVFTPCAGKMQKPGNVDQVEQVKTSANVAVRRRKRKANPRYSGNKWINSVIEEFEDSRDEETVYDPHLFKCNYCPKKFGDQKTLNAHIGYVHLGIGHQYQCPDDKCLESFTRKTSLRRHMDLLHGVFDRGVFKKIAEKSYQEFEDKVEEIITKNADQPPCQEPEVKVEIEEFQEFVQESAINLSTYVTNDADRINVDLDEIMARFDDFEKLAV